MVAVGRPLSCSPGSCSAVRTQRAVYEVIYKDEIDEDGGKQAFNGEQEDSNAARNQYSRPWMSRYWPKMSTSHLMAALTMGVYRQYCTLPYSEPLPIVASSSAILQSSPTVWTLYLNAAAPTRASRHYVLYAQPVQTFCIAHVNFDTGCACLVVSAIQELRAGREFWLPT